MFWRFLVALVALGLWCEGVIQCANLLSSKSNLWWLGSIAAIVISWLFLKLVAYLVTSAPNPTEEPVKDTDKS